MPVYDPDQLDGWLNLTASTFNHTGFGTVLVAGAYCYTELAIFFRSTGRNHHQYLLRLPKEGWPGTGIVNLTRTTKRQNPPITQNINAKGGPS